jgi:hypothetical protein
MVQTITVNLAGNDEPEFEDQYPLSDVQAYLESSGQKISLVITGVPDDQALDFVYMSGDTNSFKTNEKLYVLHDMKYGLGEKSKPRLHIGLENQLVEAEITRRLLLRDGGTQEINYTWRGQEGMIHIPSPLIEDPVFNVARDTYNSKTVTLDRLV